MKPELTTIEDLDVEGRRVLMRTDFNVPLRAQLDGTAARIADDLKLRAALPTIDELRRRGARVVLVSHLDHPHGRDRGLSMRPVATRLEELTGVAVPVAPAVIGPHVHELVEHVAPGEMLMVENVRLEPGERRGDPGFAAALADLADLYVNDAFAVSHRAYASTEGVAHWLPSAAGRLLEREVSALSALVERPNQPFFALLGGTQLSDKLPLLLALLDRANVVCLGGRLCFPFLAAGAHSIGATPCSQADLSGARLALATAARSGCRLELPHDLVLGAPSQAGRIAPRTLDGIDVPIGWSGLDIGPRTAERYAAEVAQAQTVLWNGPLGRFEVAQFARGTQSVATAIAAASAMTVVAGDDTVAALRGLGLQDHVSHISAGGSASLEFLEGRELPGVRVLMRPAIPARRPSRPAVGTGQPASRKTRDDGSRTPMASHGIRPSDDGRCNGHPGEDEGSGRQGQEGRGGAGAPSREDRQGC